jgi:hypothetical protein
MRSVVWVFVLAVAAVSLPLPAAIITQPLPEVSISVGGQAVDTSPLTITFDSVTKRGKITGSLSGPDWLLSVDVDTNPDPLIQYSLGAVNLLDTLQTFSFTFTTPLLLGPYSQLTSSFNGTMTDLLGEGVTLSSISQSALLNGVIVPAVQLGTFVCSADPNVPGTVTPCPAGPGFGPSSAGVPSAFYSTLGANVNFAISGFDAATFNGSVALDAATVPEPATATLIGLGLLCTAGWQIRSRRR